MRSLLGTLALVFALSPALSARGEARGDDIIQLKTGSILVGRVTKLTATHVEILVKGEGEARQVAIRDIMPYTVYRLKLDRIDKKSGTDHMSLGEFCLSVGLYSTAASEFQKAAELDKGVAAAAMKRREEARHEDARAKFEEAKQLRAARKYSEADRKLRLVKDRYPETPYAEEAIKEIAKIAEEIKAENAAKAKALQKKVDEAAQAKKDAAAQQKQSAVDRTVALIEEARKLWGEGLDAEPRNLTRADRAWKGAEASLLAARRNVETLLQSNDITVLKQARDLQKTIDLWLVRTYYRLGRMWSVELSYPTALEWLNKGLRVPHDDAMDRLINELLLTISQVQMRKRAAGAGF